VRSVLSRVFDWIWYRPNPVKWLLWPLSLVYRALVAIRSALYRIGMKRVSALPVPVVVVGNISVGGTGKTPCVIWLAGELGSRGYRVGIVSRGYGGQSKAWPQRVARGSDPAVVGDEPVLIARTTGCPVVVAPSRVAAARSLLETDRVDIILSDDGLQHHALGRVMEIAVIDAERGFGNGFCLPAGPLREPVSGLERVDAIVVNGRSDDGRFESAFCFSATFADFYRFDGSNERCVADFAGQKVHAVAAIGHPERFFRMLEQAGLDVVRHAHPDHERLRPEDIDFQDKLPVLMTEKDAVKFDSPLGKNVWCAPLKLRFESDHGERLIQHIIEVIGE
jgi:tetraacyldisaccharide 4'-kinase